MEKITTSAELNAAIAQLELKQVEDAKALKIAFTDTYENLKPVNLIKNSVKEIVSSPLLKENLLKIVISLAANYFLKSANTATPKSPIKKILQSLLGTVSGS